MTPPGSDRVVSKYCRVVDHAVELTLSIRGGNSGQPAVACSNMRKCVARMGPADGIVGCLVYWPLERRQ